jgi:hypothetical protein
LQGGPAIVLTHGPNFEGETRAKSPKSMVHPSSPAGLLAKKLQRDSSTLDFKDPHGGKGGFGGSSAEFLALLAQEEGRSSFREADCWRARELYTSLAPGSGVDVLVQAFGSGEGNMMVAVDLANRKIRPLNIPSLGLELRLWRTGKKLSTHEHLKNAARPGADELAPLVQKAEAAIGKKDRKIFADAVTGYGRALGAAGFLAPHSAAALAAGLALPGVVGGKGCGAMGADVLLLLLEEGAAEPPESWKTAHSLVEVLRLKI